MTHANANTEERIRIPSPRDSPAPELTERLISILKRYGQTGEYDDVDQPWWDLQHDVWRPCGYGSAGDSNSIWGCQERLVANNSDADTDKPQLMKNLEAVGFILQDADPYMEHDGAHVFVPSLDRYLPFNRPWQRTPTVDVYIIDYDPYTSERDWFNYGIGTSHLRLDDLANEFPLEADRREFGHLYPDTDLSEITEAIEKRNWSYAIYNSGISKGPVVEWFPEEEHRDRVICRYSPAFSIENSRAHSFEEKNETAACHSVDADEKNTRVVSQETAEIRFRLRNCNHVACR